MITKDKDIVAQYPNILARVVKEKGSIPAEAEFKPGFTCIFADKYFIHTRVTLPLSEIDTGVGFGLWVEVSKTSFNKYTKAEADDQKYKKFKCSGTLANYWPGFLDVFGLRVKVKTVRLDEKVYITEVKIPKKLDIDPLFKASLKISPDDKKKRKLLENLVMSYMQGE